MAKLPQYWRVLIYDAPLRRLRPMFFSGYINPCGPDQRAQHKVLHDTEDPWSTIRIETHDLLKCDKCGWYATRDPWLILYYIKHYSHIPNDFLSAALATVEPYGVTVEDQWGTVRSEYQRITALYFSDIMHAERWRGKINVGYTTDAIKHIVSYLPRSVQDVSYEHQLVLSHHVITLRGISELTHDADYQAREPDRVYQLRAEARFHQEQIRKILSEGRC